MNLLILSFWFPPAGGAGTQRIAKACKYLPKRGWTPIVVANELTVDDQAPHQDLSLSEDVESVEVLRVPSAPRRLLAHPLRGLRFQLGMDEWVDRAIPVAESIVRQRKIDAVLTSLSPFAGWRLGHRLQRRYSLPWLLDLRDPWALDGWRAWRTPLHAAWDLGRMRLALRRADAVIANTPEAASAYLAMGALPEKSCVIPNGYDREDFPDPHSNPRTETGRFIIVHVGTLHSVRETPGSTQNGKHWRNRQVAPLGRSGYFLFKALALLRTRVPALVASIHVHLHGVVHPSHMELAVRLGIDDLIVLKGYTDHRVALQALVAADAAFVPLHDTSPGERALVVPAKLYEALASGTPVLAAMPPGDAADLVRTLGGGIVVPPCDERAIADALEELVRRRSRLAPDPRVAYFERSALADLLAEVLVRTIGNRSLRDVPNPWQQVGA